MNEIFEPALSLFFLFMGVVVLVGYVVSIVWAFSDAERRGKSGCLVAIMVAMLSWPFGLLAWLIFRPERRLRDRDAPFANSGRSVDWDHRD